MKGLRSPEAFVFTFAARHDWTGIGGGGFGNGAVATESKIIFRQPTCGGKFFWMARSTYRFGKSETPFDEIGPSIEALSD